MATRTERKDVHEVVRDRYAQIARAGAPVPEAGCCGPTPDTLARRMGYQSEEIAAAPDGANLGLGCGAPLQFAAREVGETGRVIGVDMTPEMLDRARRNAEAVGAANTEFRSGRIEALPVEDASVDVVISNCVINLVPDKAAVYREVARVLRPGGRIVVSDIVLDAPLPPLVADSVAALTGCVAGAALRKDYLEMVSAAGLVDVEVVKDSGFGELVEDVVPAELRRRADAKGIDVHAVAQTVRSVTVRARKP
jgi:SAM-dependent methyltransferase